MTVPRVSIQTEDFDLSAEVAALRRENKGVGAVCSFVGTVRDRNEGDQVASMELGLPAPWSSSAGRLCILVVAPTPASGSGQASGGQGQDCTPLSNSARDSDPFLSVSSFLNR